MEINYCTECKARVSSVDIENGQGLKQEGKFFCQECVNKLGLQPVNAQTQHPSPRRRPASSTGSRRGEQVSSRPAGPADSGGNFKLLIAGLAIVVLGLGILLAVLLTRQPASAPKTTKKTAPQPAQPVPAQPVPAQPGPVSPTPAPAPQPTPVPVPQPAPVVTAAKLPAVPGARFAGKAQWASLAGSDWKSLWQVQRGNWQHENNMLVAHLTEDSGVGMLKTVSDRDHYELALTLAVSMDCALEFKFQDQGSQYGKIVMRKLVSGKWHQIFLRVEADQLITAEVNGNALKGKGNSEAQLYTDRLAEYGRLSLTVSNLKYGNCLVGIAEAAIKKIIPAGGPAKRTFNLVRTDKGERFKDGHKGIPKPEYAQKAGEVYVQIGPKGHAGFWDKPGDWTGFKEFVFDYHNPESNEVKVSLLIGDTASKEAWGWENRVIVEYRLRPGWGKARIKLKTRCNNGRDVDLSDVQTWNISLSGNHAYVRNVRLEGAPIE